MRTTLLYALAIFAAFAIVSLAPTGQAQATPGTVLSAQNGKLPRQRHRPAEVGPIACGKTGCHHIPAGCHPQMTFAFGNPTGYEIAVCPPRRER